MKILGPNDEPLAINGVLQFHDGEPTMHIRKIVIRDFRSIQALDTEIPARGMTVAGPNGIGKTNFVRAIRAALTGVGVAPDAIRDGADSSEIMVDTDDPRLSRIRQRITPNGGTVAITTKDGDKVARPREKLSETLGLSPFDPLAFYQANGKDQRRMVLEAMPVKVDAQDVARWTDDCLPLNLNFNQNGLAVLSELHKFYYDRRAAANKDADAAKAAHKLASDKAESLMRDEHKGVAVPLPGQEDEPVRAAEKAREALEQRRRQAEVQAGRTGGARARIAELRSEATAAEEVLGMPPSMAWFEQLEGGIAIKRAEVEALKAKLAEAEAVLKDAEKRASDWKAQVDTYEKAEKEIAGKRRQADELEATLTTTAITPPTSDELAQADAAVAQARALRELVLSARAAHDALVEAAALGDEVTAAQADAKRLDDIVKRLANDAPVELAARANLIPGLTLAEDGVLYEGRPIDDSMSGAQRMLVAVQIAKLANAKAGLLLVDEIGILDDEHMREFVKLCTADGWQLISTCMRNVKDAEGKPVREMVLEAIELEEAA